MYGVQKGLVSTLQLNAGQNTFMAMFDVMQYVFEKKISIKFAQTMVHCNICTRDRKKFYF